MSFNRIPADLRAYPQWVTWRFEDRGGTKLAKVPFSPRNSQAASVTDATTWASFGESIAAFDNGGFDGIGFVFSFTSSTERIHRRDAVIIRAVSP